MKTKYLILIFTAVLFLSCSKYTNISKDKDSKNNFIISKHKVGAYSINMPIADIFKLTDKKYIKKVISQGEFQDDLYTDYKIYDKNSVHLLTLSYFINNEKNPKVENISIISPLYYTKKGLNINSTFEDIKNNYIIEKIEPNQNSIILYLKELNAHISINKQYLKKNWWNKKEQKVNTNAILDSAKIEYFILY